MRKNLFMIRHAESIFSPEDNDFDRPLSKKGKMDAYNIIKYFENIHIKKVFSSPYIRSISTVAGVARDKGLDIELIDGLRERKVANKHVKDFISFTKQQWTDFDYKLEGGESLNEVQTRGVEALKVVLNKFKEGNVIVGTHGTLLGVLLNYFDQKYDYYFWKNLKMPDIVLISYEKEELDLIKLIDF